MAGVEITVVCGDVRKTVFADEKDRLQKILRDANVFAPAPCGGRGVCGKCKVKVVSGVLPVTPADLSNLPPEELDDDFRLACAAFPVSGLVVEAVAEDESFSAVTAHNEDFLLKSGVASEKVPLLKSKESLTRRIIGRPGESVTAEILRSCSQIAENGLEAAYVTRANGVILRVEPSPKALFVAAVDIGTTTLGFALANLQKGKIVGRLSLLNEQRQYGADVLSRIQFAANGGGPALSGMIKKQILEGLRRLCRECAVEEDSVAKIVVVGNTSMLHMFLGLSCKNLGAYPFTPVSLDILRLKFSEVFGLDAPCVVDVLPGLSAYVGSDVVAGILFTGLGSEKRPALLLDLGTNGEIALSCESGIYCTSAAAGPAFEGGNISCGVGSVPGAISSVRFEGKDLQVSTIGNRPPCGICGSGVIDAAAQCVARGYVDSGGRFTSSHKQGVVLAATARGEEIRFTQKDIREVQLAKSAIRSGIDAVLRLAGLKYEDIGVFYVAGGFGYEMNFESGAIIGLFPEDLLGKMTAAGNSALGGALKYVFDPNAAEDLDFIVKHSKEFSLSEDKTFNGAFLENVSFPSSSGTPVR